MSLDLEMSCVLGDLLQDKLKIGSRYKVTYVKHRGEFQSERHTFTGELFEIEKPSRFYSPASISLKRKGSGICLDASSIIRIQEVS